MGARPGGVSRAARTQNAARTVSRRRDRASSRRVGRRVTADAFAGAARAAADRLMPRDVALGSGAEFALIAKLRERWGARAAGIGDDASLVSVPRGEQVVVSTDASIEGVHFK